MRKNLILRNGGSQNPDRWLKEPRNNQFGNIWVFDRNSNIDIKMYKFSDGVKVVNGDKVIMDKDSFDKIINLVRM